jgi:lysophospholipase L1-like esterase
MHHIINLFIGFSLFTFLGQMPNGENNMGKEKMLRYLALGDSYTIGEAVDKNGRWPVQLADSLRSRGIHVSDPVIVARTGWTTAELAGGILEAKPQGTFNLVSLLIGVNNQYRGGDPDIYRKEFRDLLQQAIAFAAGDSQKVLVLSIPDWGVTPFAQSRDPKRIAEEIDHFNAINCEEALHKGVHYIDITDLSRQAITDSTLLASDGLHPSQRIYAQWVERALPVAETILIPAERD